MKTILITVTKDRKHYFHTYVKEDKAEQVYNDIKSKFVKDEGYSVSSEDSTLTTDHIQWLSALINMPDDITDERIIDIFRNEILSGR